MDVFVSLDVPPVAVDVLPELAVPELVVPAPLVSLAGAVDDAPPAEALEFVDFDESVL